MELSELESQLFALQNIKSKAIKELNYDLAARSRDKIKVLEKLIQQTKIMNEDLYILGMAKSSLNITKAGTSRNLELDVLRLINFVNLFSDKEIKVYGVMMVYNKEIKDRILNVWLPKYSFTNFDYFKILTFESDEYFLEKKEEIVLEKKNNSTFLNSGAPMGEKIIEQILTNKLENCFKVENLHRIEITDFNGIRWDFNKLFKVSV